MAADTVSHQLGRDGFVWFIGVVEEVDDPLKAKRCKVRIFGWHDKDTDTAHTEDLPWAYALVPITDAQALPNYKQGDWVVGFFLDAHAGQQPIIFGVLPAIAQP
jgi:hypothetical protein